MIDGRYYKHRVFPENNPDLVQCIWASRLRLDMRFGSNQHLWNYLGPRSKARLTWRSARRTVRRTGTSLHSLRQAWQLRKS